MNWCGWKCTAYQYRMSLYCTFIYFLTLICDNILYLQWITCLLHCHCSYFFNDSIAGPKYCDVNNPNSRHPGDCHRFYHCKDTLEGPELVEKTCGPYMMYNHMKQVCDWPAAVIALRPECAGTVQASLEILIVMKVKIPQGCDAI
jgi:hypothetical protein